MSTRGDVARPRARSAHECYKLQGKSVERLTDWREKSRREEQGVPSYSAREIHRMAGLSIPMPLARAAVGRAVARAKEYKRVVAESVCTQEAAAAAALASAL